MPPSPQDDTISQTDQAQRTDPVAAMFGRIAPFYDLLNHSLSIGQDIRWRRKLVDAVAPPPNGLVLDLAAGTLDVTVALRRRWPQLTVAALDFTRPMLARGLKRKLTRPLAVRVAAVQADGRALPLPDACLDGATIAFGIRNIRPREACYAEVLRCLKPGARFCILEFGTGRKRIWRGLYNFYLNRVLPGIGRLVSHDPKAYRYLADTIREFPAEDELATELLDAGFKDVYHRPLTSGIVFLHVASKGRSLSPDKNGLTQGGTMR